MRREDNEGNYVQLHSGLKSLDKIISLFNIFNFRIEKLS